MPHMILKRVWDYCTYSKKFLAFVLILLFISAFIQNYVQIMGNSLEVTLIDLLVIILLGGYGMTITRDRINHGKRLPKIQIKEILVFGIKSTIVIFIYVYVQGVIVDYICSPLHFPPFDLEDMLLNWSHTLHMLYTHNPINTIIFLVVGAVLFYASSFFMEIALAKLADTNNMWSSFNLISIKRSIDVIGWRNYTKEYTLIILVIVFLSYLMSFEVPFFFIDALKDVFLSFLIFATQYLGIGAIYCNIKDEESRIHVPVD